MCSHSVEERGARLLRSCLLALAVGAAVSACADTTNAVEPCQWTGPVHLVDYNPVVIPDSLLWYRKVSYQSFDYPQDDSGVVLFEYDGGYHYNPVQMAQKGLWFADNFLTTGDSAYLRRSEANANKLLAVADTFGDALYFPYYFAFRLHNLASQTMPVPWYSGIAQGQALSLFLRLHRITGKPEYMQAASAIMPGFLRLYGQAEPYYARIDCKGYYWIEEYPMAQSTQTLNGFIFALMGVYEYWRETKDPEAEWIIRASLATIKAYLPQFRVPGEPSYYCLKHKFQYLVYHRIHIEQMTYLERMSGDTTFTHWQRLLEQDAS